MSIERVSTCCKFIGRKGTCVFPGKPGEWIPSCAFRQKFDGDFWCVPDQGKSEEDCSHFVEVGDNPNAPLRPTGIRGSNSGC